MNKEINEVLKAMRVKLAAGWTQRAAARTANGAAILSSEKEACEFCLMGALWSLDVASLSLESCVESELAQTLDAQGLIGTLITYNDAPGRTQSDILALVDKTIERLERQ